MKALMYGAGNIGRGFIGQLFSQSGYEVVFVDVDETVVKALNERRRYTVRAVDNTGHEDITVENLRAVDGRDAKLVANEIASADIMATAVGVNVLPRIVPVIREGLRARWAKGAGPLNVLICENKLDADKYLRNLLGDGMSPDELKMLHSELGLVEASIGRMVPVMTPEQKKEDPLLVCVEPYANLPVDRDAFIGAIPRIIGMEPCAPFKAYIERKLFVHNMGHAAAAYLGMYGGREYIYEAMEDPYITLCVENAMLESVRALLKRAPELSDNFFGNMFDLITRFRNRALKDTTARVGADPARKLGRNDRLVGAAHAAMEGGIFPAFIALGAAAGVHSFMKQDANATLFDIVARQGGFPEDSEFYRLVERYGGALRSGRTMEELFQIAESARRKSLGNVM